MSGIILIFGFIYREFLATTPVVEDYASAVQLTTFVINLLGSLLLVASVWVLLKLLWRLSQLLHADSPVREITRTYSEFTAAIVGLLASIFGYITAWVWAGAALVYLVQDVLQHGVVLDLKSGLLLLLILHPLVRRWLFR